MAATPGRIVLVAVDASEHSRAAFDWYLEKIFRVDDRVIVAHIPETPDLPNLSFKEAGLSLPFAEWQKAIEESISKVNKLQADYEADLVSRKVQYKMVGDHHGKIGEAIIRESEKENADMIIMGTRGLSGIKRTILGSVSDYVVHHSQVPVLVCPNKNA